MSEQIKPECIDRFTTLSENYAVLKNEMEHNSEMTKAILKAVRGSNGNTGLATKVEVMESDIRHLKKKEKVIDETIIKADVSESAIKRAWWWLGGVSLAILGIAGWSIKRGG